MPARLSTENHFREILYKRRNIKYIGGIDPKSHFPSSCVFSRVSGLRPDTKDGTKREEHEI